MYRDKTGVERYNLFRSGLKVLRNGSLVIDRFVEDDQGLYWCEEDNYWNKQPTVISVKKGQKTIVIVIICSLKTALYPVLYILDLQRLVVNY